MNSADVLRRLPSRLAERVSAAEREQLARLVTEWDQQSERLRKLPLSPEEPAAPLTLEVPE